MFADFLTAEIGIISLLSLLSALVTSILGFGAGLVLTPLLTFFMPLKEALGIGALVYLVTSTSKTWWYVPDINKRLWAKALPASFAGLACGMFILQYAPAQTLEIIFSVVLLYFSISNLINASESRPELPQPVYPLLAGMASILVHAAGVFFFRYCRLNALDRVQTVATMAALHLTLNIFKATFFTASGLVDPRYILQLIPAYLCAILGTRLGKTILVKYVSEKVFSNAVSALLILLAARMLWHAV